MAKAESRDRLEVAADRLIERAASRACTVLLGFATATFLCGALAWFHSLFDPLPKTTGAIISIALISAGVAPPILFHLRFHGFGRRAHDDTLATRRRLPDCVSDLRLGWQLTGGVALSTGVLTALVVVAGPTLDALYDWTLESNLWLDAQRRMAEVLLVVITVGLVSGLAGLVAVCLSPRFSDAAPERSRSMAWGAMFGGAMGVILTERIVLPNGSDRAAMLLAAGTWLALSAICFAVSRGKADTDVSSRGVVSPPESTGALEPIILAGLVCWGAAIGLSGSVCARVASYEEAVGAAPAAITVTAWLLWLCTGVALAGVIKPHRRHSAGGSGFALWLSGVAACAAVGALAAVSRSASVPLIGRKIVVRPAAVSIALGGFFAGLALPYVKRALTRYRGGHPATFADFLSAVLVGAGLGMWVGGGWLIEHIGVITVQCLSGLLCIAVGGVLLLNERSGSPAWRKCRGVMVFGSLVALGVLFPYWARRATMASDGLTASLRGNSWLLNNDASDERPIGSVRLASLGPADRLDEIENDVDPISSLLWSICFSDPGQRACVIGSDVGSLNAWAHAGFRELDHWAPDAVFGRSPVAAADPSVIRYSRHRGAAMGSWRTWRSSYDLVVLRPVAIQTARNAPIWTAESFARLARTLGPGGRLVVVLPTFDLDAGSLRIVAAGLTAAMSGEVLWRAWPSADQPEQVWLLACLAPVDRDWAADALAGGWHSVREIVSSAERIQLHTYRTPRLGSSGSMRSDRERRRRSLEALIEPQARSSDVRPASVRGQVE